MVIQCASETEISHVYLMSQQVLDYLKIKTYLPVLFSLTIVQYESDFVVLDFDVVVAKCLFVTPIDKVIDEYSCELF